MYPCVTMRWLHVKPYVACAIKGTRLTLFNIGRKEHTVGGPYGDVVSLTTI